MSMSDEFKNKEEDIKKRSYWKEVKV